MLGDLWGQVIKEHAVSAHEIADPMSREASCHIRRPDYPETAMLDSVHVGTVLTLSVEPSF
jgi:hypothetical protein